MVAYQYTVATTLFDKSIRITVLVCITCIKVTVHLPWYYYHWMPKF